MPIPLLAIGAGAALIKGIGGAIQTSKANKALRELNEQPLDNYDVSPEMQNAYSRAERMSAYGFAPEEKTQFNQQLARQNNSIARSALDMSGGNMGSAINSVLQANNTSAINQFAGQDAGLRRDNMRYADSLAGAIQTQKNLQTQQKIARRQMMEEAYGRASAMGKENMYGSLDEITNLAVTGIKDNTAAKQLATAELQKQQQKQQIYDENGNLIEVD